MSPKPLSFEAVKLSLKQDRNGIVLTLAIHPNEMPADLWRSPTGQRYGVALVELNENELIREMEEEGARVYRMFNAKCRVKHFQVWVLQGEPWMDDREKNTREIIKSDIGVVSAKEIPYNQDAQRKFLEIVKRYDQPDQEPYRQAGR